MKFLFKYVIIAFKDYSGMFVTGDLKLRALIVPPSIGIFMPLCAFFV